MKKKSLKKKFIPKMPRELWVLREDVQSGPRTSLFSNPRTLVWAWEPTHRLNDFARYVLARKQK